MSKVVLNIGRPKTGKTTKAKQLLDISVKMGRKSDIIVYDYNNEFKPYYDAPFLDRNDFMEFIAPMTNKIFLFEEATIFFSNTSHDKILTDMLVRKRHTNNQFILNFHSIRNVPRYIMDLSDFVVLFKTNDTEKFVIQKNDNEKFLDCFREVKNNPNPHFCKTFNLYS